MTRLRRRTTLATGAALATAIVLTGCGGGSHNTSSSSAGRAVAPQAAGGGGDTAGGPAAAKEAAPGAGATGTNQPALAPDLSVDQRSIIYTGSITIRVKDVNQAATKATAIATGAGGFVGADKRDIANTSSDATLELRVPAEKFSAVVNELAATLGTEEQRGINTEDVTEQTVDLDARIAVQQARVDSGRQLLSKAKTLNDLVMLEREVATRESDLASLQAKKRRLADLTALSTISVVLLGPTAQVVPKPAGPPGFLAGLSSGWRALVASLAVLLTVLGALLPWLIALGLPAWGIVFLVRRYLRRRPVLALAGASALPPASGAPATPEGRSDSPPGP